MKPILLLLFFTSIFFYSCKKKPEGCTNCSAVNYNSRAENDDGSCLFQEGKIIFWTSNTQPPFKLSVICRSTSSNCPLVLGNDIGEVIDSIYSSAPLWGKIGCLSYKTYVGDYRWVAGFYPNPKSGMVITSQGNIHVAKDSIIVVHVL